MCCLDSLEASTAVRISDTPLLGASIVDLGNALQRLTVATEDARVVAYTWADGSWKESNSQLLPVETTQGRIAGAVSISAQPDLGSEIVVVSTALATLFMDSQSLALIGRLDSAGQLITGHVTHCPACGSIALKSAGLVGEDTKEGKCSMTGLSGGDGEQAAPICLRNSTSSCRSFDRALRTTHEVAEAGAWLTLNSQAILGLRRRPRAANGQHVSRERRASTQQLRQRRRVSLTPQAQGDGQDEWEAYKLTLDGELETAIIGATVSDAVDSGHDVVLYVNKAGPVVPLDSQSVAVAFGNTVKVIRSSRRGSLAKRSSGPTLERHASSSKRRLTLRKAL